MKIDLDKYQEFYSGEVNNLSSDSVDLNRIPKHIAFIMDGNGRWAQARGLKRTDGHEAGIKSLREIIVACVRLGVDYMSIYAFSTENWKRSAFEVNTLMRLFAEVLLKELPTFHENNVRLKFLGDMSALPKKTRETFNKGLKETSKNNGMVLAMAVNYGSRSEIINAVKSIAQDIKDGAIASKDINEEMLSSRLYTEGMPDPDLLIRTSGETRLSNFLLWQIAYSEIYVTNELWPDFYRWQLMEALTEYQSRDRRFGGVKNE